MKRISILIAAVWMAAASFYCGPRIVENGGSGTETVGITGCAVDSNQNPIIGATVKLRRSDFLDTQTVAKHGNGMFLAETNTDQFGKYHFGPIDTGTFFIEINDGNHHGVLSRCTVNTVDSSYSISKAILRQTGSVFGKVSQTPQTDSVDFAVAVYGLSGHTQKTMRNGEFFLTDIPFGTYTIRIVPHVPIYISTETVVQIAGGRVDTLNAIKMSTPFYAVYPPDSCVVRAILDSNKWYSLPISSIVEIDSNKPHRVTKLFVAFKHFSNLTSNIGKLSELRTIDLEGLQDSLTLPAEIGNCKKLHELILTECRLETLPPAIGDIDSLAKLIVGGNFLRDLPDGFQRLQALEVLDISRNSFTKIPDGILQCKSLKVLLASRNLISEFTLYLGKFTDLQILDVSDNVLKTFPMIIAETEASRPFINVDGNKLCDVPDAIKNWLNTYSYSFGSTRNWSGAQNCNPSFSPIPDKP